MAYIQSLKNGDSIKISIASDNLSLQMKEWPEMFWSEVGYVDPKASMDLNKIEDYSENNDEIDD